MASYASIDKGLLQSLTVWFPPAEKEALRLQAFVHKTTMARVIRAALAEFAQTHPVPTAELQARFEALVPAPDKVA